MDWMPFPGRVDKAAFISGKAASFKYSRMPNFPRASSKGGLAGFESELSITQNAVAFWANQVRFFKERFQRCSILPSGMSCPPRLTRAATRSLAKDTEDRAM